MFSRFVETKLDKIKQNEHAQETKIDDFDFAELQDFAKLLRLTDYILTKHENRKHVHALMKDFVEVISNSSHSIESLDDEIMEMVISAENTISHIKDLQSNISEKYTFDKSENRTKSSGNNLTNTSTPVYTAEYQQSSTVETEQVI